MRFFTIFLVLATNVFANEVAGVDMSFAALYANAHIVVKCVIVILVAFSVISWSIFLAKYMHFRFAFNRLKNDKERFLRLNRINQDINLDNQSFLNDFLSIANSQLDQKHRQNERIKELINLNQTRTLNLMRSYIGILASIGSSAPFIGLFGTVWGIMNSFIGIASANNASLAVVAPGIAEALFATALGLAAAIPAVLIYNCLIRMNAKFKDELNELATKVYALAIREIV